MSDVVVLAGLRCRGFHGVLAQERRDGQEFLVDARLELDTAPAAAADDLRLTVDYAALAQALSAAVGRDPVDLIETLAQRLADVCLAAGPVRAVTLTVHKPQAPVGLPFGDVAVTIRREQA